jgi:dihydrofolate reductase
MKKCSVFIKTSLEGYISRTDGSIDWLKEANASVPPGEVLGYAGFLSTVVALVMGRSTFEQVLSFPEWPYGA